MNATPVGNRLHIDGIRGLSRKPSLVIGDSQVVLKVSNDIPDDVKCTTFSILFSRQKGDRAEFVRGVLKRALLSPFPHEQSLLEG